MKKVKRLLSLILVVMLVLSSLNVALAEVTITEIPLRVKEKMDAESSNAVIFTDSNGIFEIVILDGVIEDDQLILDESSNPPYVDSYVMDEISSYKSADNGETWTTGGSGYGFQLSSPDLEVVYADMDVFGTDYSTVIYNSTEDNVVPFQTPANLTNYNIALGNVTEEDYTVESWAAYQDIVDENEVTEYNSQSEVNAATANIVLAQNDLVLKTVGSDLTAYNNALESVRSNDFTPNSWAIYQEVVSANVVTSSNTQVEVDEATNSIISAQASLVAVADFTAFNDAYYGTLTSDSYTTESWAQYQLILDGVNSDITLNSSQAEVDSATNTLIEAQTNLVLKPVTDLTEYNNVLSKVLVESDYTAESWSEYQDTINTNVMTTSNTQEEVDIATENISYAQQLLVFAGQADLTAALNAVNELVYYDYTVVTWDALIAVIHRPVHTQAEVVQQTSDIYDAIDALVKNTGNLIDYNTALSEVVEANYTVESWETYQNVVNSNVVTVDNLQSEINAATANITAAQGALVAKPTGTDLTIYNQVLARVNEADYTPESWATYMLVVNANIVTSANTNLEVNEAATNIALAQNSLVLKTTGSDLTAYNAALANVVEEDYTAVSWGDYQGVVSENIVFASDTQEYIDEATQNIIAAQAYLVLKSNDSTLEYVTITGVGYTFEGFDPGTFEYNISLPYGTEGLPTVNATKNSEFAQITGNVQVTELPGTATITVTAENGDTSTYTFNFTVASPPVDYMSVDRTEALMGENITLKFTDMLNLMNKYPNLRFATFINGELTGIEVLYPFDFPGGNQEYRLYSSSVIDESAEIIHILYAEIPSNPLPTDEGIDRIQVTFYKTFPVDLTAYNEVLNSVKQEDYTVDSWAIYQEVVNENIVTVYNTQVEVDTATFNIETAQSSLVLKPTGTDLTIYNQVLERVNEANFTPESWEIYQLVVNDNIVTSANTTEEVAQAATNIALAQNNLVLKQTSDLTEYNDVISSLNKEDFTSDSWATYKLVVDTNLMTTSNTQVEINAAVQTILNAQKDLVFSHQSKLDEQMAILDTLVETDYTPGSWSNIEIALLLDELTNDDVFYKAESIGTAVSYLIAIPGDLTEYLELADSTEPTDYTPESWEIFITEVLNNYMVTGDDLQSVIDKATADIRLLMETVLVPVSSGEVTLINYDEALSRVHEEDYTTESWAEYMIIVDFNRVTLDNTQEEIDSAADRIIEAQEMILVLKETEVDFTEYYMLLDFVRESDYTTESWKTYTDLIAELGIDENSTQEEVDEAVFAIFEAQQNLILLETMDMYNRLTHIQNRGYTPESWSLYLDEIEYNKLTENFTREELDTAISNLTDKVFLLRTLFTKENYDFIIEYAEVHKDEFSEEDMNAFNEIVNNNQITSENTPMEVNDAVATIGRELSELNRLDGKANTLSYDLLESMTSEEMFTPDSWTEYKNVLDSYGVISDMTEKHYEAVLNHILLLQKFLVEKGDLTAYRELLASVKQSDYTTDSWNAYQLVVAANVVNNNSSREEVNLAIANITNAKANLVRKPVDIGGGSGGSGSGGSITPPVPPVPPVVPVVDNTKLEFVVDNEKVVVPVKETVALKEEIKGYVRGYNDNTFRPENKVTRAETTQMLSNILETSGMLKSDITDVRSDSWYAGAVGGVVNAGIMNGYGDKTFKPEKNITRQEFAVTLVNMLDLSSMKQDTNKEFTDIEGIYGKDAIQMLASLGVLSGYPDGTFKPNNEITRAEMVVILNRLLGDKLKTGTFGDVEFTDIEDSWAREEIMRAVNK